MLFDFSGTLFRLEFDADLTAGLTDSSGAPVDDESHAKLLRMLTAPAGPSADLPPDLLDDWERRDLDADLHRRVNVAALRHSGLTEDGVAEAFYERLLDPRYWKPYPDTLDVLATVRSAGLPVAVVSNIAWDIRDVFELHGAAGYVDEYVLSYVEGVVKPDPKIFAAACERIGVTPSEALMVGDSKEADGAPPRSAPPWRSWNRCRRWSDRTRCCEPSAPPPSADAPTAQWSARVLTYHRTGDLAPVRHLGPRRAGFPARVPREGVHLCLWRDTAG